MARRDYVHYAAGRIVFGLLVVALGVILTLDNLNVLKAHDVLRYWPVALVVFGLVKAFEPRGGCGRVFWGFLSILGVLLLFSQLGYITWNVWDLWPLFLVLLGGSMIGRAFYRRSCCTGWRGAKVHRNRGSGDGWSSGGGQGTSPAPGFGKGSAGSSTGSPSVDPEGGRNAGLGGTPGAGLGSNLGGDPSSTLDDFTLFGGTDRTIVSQDFRGGRITTIMGGCDIDLRRASIAQGEAELTVFALFGGIELRVPEDWTVVLRVTPILGGAEDSTRKPSGGSRKTLIVTGEVVMGGFEIKN